MLALLSSCIPLSTVLTSISITVNRDGTVTKDPSVQEIGAATSFHALGFSSLGDLIVAECDGKFTMDVWERVLKMARSEIRREGQEASDADENVSVALEHEAIRKGDLRSTIQGEIVRQQRWKKSSI